MRNTKILVEIFYQTVPSARETGEKETRINERIFMIK